MGSQILENMVLTGFPLALENLRKLEFFLSSQRNSRNFGKISKIRGILNDSGKSVIHKLKFNQELKFYWVNFGWWCVSRSSDRPEVSVKFWIIWVSCERFGRCKTNILVWQLRSIVSHFKWCHIFRLRESSATSCTDWSGKACQIRKKWNTFWRQKMHSRNMRLVFTVFQTL